MIGQTIFFLSMKQREKYFNNKVQGVSKGELVLKLVRFIQNYKNTVARFSNLCRNCTSKNNFPHYSIFLNF